MAPAQIMDIPPTSTIYTHKKFQGKQQQYAHKKFGTRMAPQKTEDSQTKDLFPNNATQNTEQQTKRTSGDLFRPYALPDKTPRKRKHHEIQEVSEEQQQFMDFKRFAPAPIISSEFMPSYQHHFNNMPLQQPYYRLQHYQFDAQTFAIILQKQQAALCMGAIIKQQTNLNLYNIMGQ